ncbi:class F sortase [Streptomyces sp. V3I7]|uniref:class F sortase n=1 Tax=Streptomyces sp. V3I7 TaxID=3042278 RepID=UPI0027826B6E|nr:class F sortase [Streptomyces sp. V3I7]MDQ0994566.1 LPXTG-site transpeptidase (sortase) family protein [Streptomyces sp. V3I7]
MAARSSSPTPATQGPRCGGQMAVWGFVLLLLAVGLLGGKPPAGASEPPRTKGAAALAHPAGKHLPRSRPTRLLIPKIGVDAPFTDLTLGPSGQLLPPPAGDVNLVGWYSKGASPGEPGTSIIAGHVDTTTSAAVFAGLEELDAGDTFTVLRADGRKATFKVDTAETYEKDAFPSRQVYADTPRAEARLITCAGDYDHTARDYTENLVVYAHLV